MTAVLFHETVTKSLTDVVCAKATPHITSCTGDFGDGIANQVKKLRDPVLLMGNITCFGKQAILDLQKNIFLRNFFSFFSKIRSIQLDIRIKIR